MPFFQAPISSITTEYKIEYKETMKRSNSTNVHLTKSGHYCSGKPFIPQSRRGEFFSLDSHLAPPKRRNMEIKNSNDLSPLEQRETRIFWNCARYIASIPSPFHHSKPRCQQPTGVLATCWFFETVFYQGCIETLMGGLLDEFGDWNAVYLSSRFGRWEKRFPKKGGETAGYGLSRAPPLQRPAELSA